MATAAEVRAKLDSLSEDDFSNTVQKLPGGTGIARSNSREVATDHVMKYLNKFDGLHEHTERLFCKALGLESEESRRNRATIDAAHYARRAYYAAVVSIVVGIVGVVVAVLSPLAR